jgi:hypothetical protein
MKLKGISPQLGIPIARGDLKVTKDDEIRKSS